MVVMNRGGGGHGRGAVVGRAKKPGVGLREAAIRREDVAGDPGDLTLPVRDHRSPSVYHLYIYDK